MPDKFLIKLWLNSILVYYVYMYVFGNVPLILRNFVSSDLKMGITLFTSENGSCVELINTLW